MNILKRCTVPISIAVVVISVALIFSCEAHASDLADLECLYILSARGPTEEELKSYYPSARTEKERNSEYWNDYYDNLPTYYMTRLGEDRNMYVMMGDTWIKKVIGEPDEGVPAWAIDPWGLYAVETIEYKNSDREGWVYRPSKTIYRWPTYLERYDAWWNPSWKSVEEYKEGK